MHAAVFNSFLSFLVVVSGDNCGLRTESQISHPLQGFECSTPRRRWEFASRVVECSSPWITPGSLGQLISRFIYYLHKRRQQQQRGEKVHRHRPIESRNCWAKEMALFRSLRPFLPHWKCTQASREQISICTKCIARYLEWHIINFTVEFVAFFLWNFKF